MARRACIREVGIILANSTFFLLLSWTSLTLAAPDDRTDVLARGVGTVMVQGTPTEDPAVTALNKEKLTQEIDQLKNQNFWSSWASLATPFSIIAGFGGGIFALVRYLRDQKGERKKQHEDRQIELQNREEAEAHRREDQLIEQRKRDEERFRSVCIGLGDEKEGARVGAAIILRTFLQTGYEQFYQQAFDLTVANLRLRHVDSDKLDSPDSLSQALIMAFKKSFPLVRREMSKDNAPFNPQSLDASHVHLDSAYLAMSELPDIWIPDASFRKADLSEANLARATLARASLEEANLTRASLEEANLEKANLTRATLTRANLTRVYLFKANLSEANLERATLNEVNFSEANLKGANLRWANLREANLSKVDLRGVNLRKVDFSKVDLRGANLSKVDLREVNLLGAILMWADLKGAILNWANLSGALLIEADMRSVHGLTSKELKDCKERGAKVDDIASHGNELASQVATSIQEEDTPKQASVLTQEARPSLSNDAQATQNLIPTPAQSDEKPWTETEDKSS